MPLPVTKSADLRENAPLATTGGLGIAAGINTLTNGWPWYGSLLLFVAVTAAGLVPQVFTKRAS